MADLNLDMQLLQRMHDDLDRIASAFSGADAFSQQAAADVGHDELAGHVREFAEKWNDKREAMTKKITALAKSTAAVTDGFTKADAGLAKALRDSADTARRQGIPLTPAPGRTE